ncbi:hypothetical protein D1007_38508 [Hordeum vulgare]|nr:hypothetical protein D1007_38508 [Hordeum vulgare]
MLEAPQEGVQKASVLSRGIMDATFTALNGVAVEMTKVEEEAMAAHATCEGALKEAKAAVERCEEVETHLIALQGEHAKLVEQRCSQEEELKAHEAKLAAREGELSQKASRLDTEQEHLVEREKDATTREALLEAQEKALTAAEERKASELACFPDVELGLHKALRSLCQDGFDDPLATPEEGFAVLAKGLVATLEAVVTQMDKILDSECRDLFFAAVTRVFSHLHIRDPGFDLSSMTVLVPAEARDHAAEAVKGLVEALVRRFARVAPSFSPGTTGGDDGEDDASDIDDQPPVEGVTCGGYS